MKTQSVTDSVSRPKAQSVMAVSGGRKDVVNQCLEFGGGSGQSEERSAVSIGSLRGVFNQRRW